MQQQGYCFGFVEFQSFSSVNRAIEVLSLLYSIFIEIFFVVFGIWMLEVIGFHLSSQLPSGSNMFSLFPFFGYSNPIEDYNQLIGHHAVYQALDHSLLSC